jgi:hypothetical protein
MASGLPLQPVAGIQNSNLSKIEFYQIKKFHVRNYLKSTEYFCAVRMREVQANLIPDFFTCFVVLSIFVAPLPLKNSIMHEFESKNKVQGLLKNCSFTCLIMSHFFADPLLHTLDRPADK